MSTGSTCGHQAFTSPSWSLFQTVGAETCTLGLWQGLLLFLFAQRTQIMGCLSSYSPLLISWHTGLSPGIPSMLLTPCWETQQTLPQCPLYYLRSGLQTVYHVTCGEGTGKMQACPKKSARKDEDRGMVCGHLLQDHSFYRGCLANCLSFP